MFAAYFLLIKKILNVSLKTAKLKNTPVIPIRVSSAADNFPTISFFYNLPDKEPPTFENTLPLTWMIVRSLVVQIIAVLFFDN